VILQTESSGISEVRSATDANRLMSVPESTQWFQLGYLKSGCRRTAGDYHVSITQPFEIATTEVTAGQFAQFVQGTGYKTEAERSGKGALGVVRGHGLTPRRSAVEQA